MIHPDKISSIAGMSVVITRPSLQSDYIHRRLIDLGAKPILFPCIEIVPLDCQAAIQALPVNIQEIDIFIFISSNAVTCGMGQIAALNNLIKSSKTFAAVGQATAQSLQQAGAQNILAPERSFDSDQLLQLLELASVQDKAILIVKGVGGRTSLYDALIERRANVYTVDVYQRQLPTNSNPSVLQPPIDAIFFTSSEIVENMLQLSPASSHGMLLQCQSITGHPRIAAKVTSLGFQKLPIIATNPSDAEMLAALQEWANRTENHNEH